MKKAFENKPKFFFLVEIILVSVAIIAAFAAGYIYKDFSDSPAEEKQDTSLKVYSYSDEELEAIVNQKALTGTVTKSSASSVTVVSAGKSFAFVITEDTAIERGVSLKKSAYNDLTTGKTVTVTYDNKTKEAINIWFEK